MPKGHNCTRSTKEFQKTGKFLSKSTLFRLTTAFGCLFATAGTDLVLDWPATFFTRCTTAGLAHFLLLKANMIYSAFALFKNKISVLIVNPVKADFSIGQDLRGYGDKSLVLTTVKMILKLKHSIQRWRNK